MPDPVGGAVSCAAAAAGAAACACDVTAEQNDTAQIQAAAIMK